MTGFWWFALGAFVGTIFAIGIMAVLRMGSDDGDAAPEWDALRGAAPDCTEGLPSEVWVRRQRDEWDRYPLTSEEPHGDC